VGCVRKNNEDSYGLDLADGGGDRSMFVVADGMGGAAAGEIASKLAVDTVRDSFFAAKEVPVPEALERAIREANRSIYQKSLEDPALAGMGTTCTVAAIFGTELWVGHVGDSRAYLAKDGAMNQITRDHSLAAELERRGDARGKSPNAKHVLTRCLGVNEEVAIDITKEPRGLPEGASLVLCSDGLSNLVDPGEILQLVSMHLPEKACRRLIDLAKERGAPDNVTVVVAHVRGV
jgi:protein phosphatase